MRSVSDDLSSRFSSLGLRLNSRKLELLPTSCELTFLKTRFRLRADGVVDKRLPSETLRRRRKHMAGLRRLQSAGVLESSDLAASKAAFKGVRLRIAR